MDRKQLYNMMRDMIRSNTLVGARLLDIIKSQLIKESDESVIKDILRSIVPIIIKNYIPLN